MPLDVSIKQGPEPQLECLGNLWWCKNVYTIGPLAAPGHVYTTEGFAAPGRVCTTEAFAASGHGYTVTHTTGASAARSAPGLLQTKEA